MVDPASIKYALIYEHINQEMGVDQIITEQLSIYLTRHLWYIDLEKTLDMCYVQEEQYLHNFMLTKHQSNDK